MNPDTIGYVWTGEFALNTLRVDGEIFESGTKKFRIRKYLDTCGQGLSRTKDRRESRNLLDLYVQKLLKHKYTDNVMDM